MNILMNRLLSCQCESALNLCDVVISMIACAVQLSDWLAEKMLAAQDETYRDAKNIHSKWMRHQAFESEIKSNKDRLERLVKEANDLIEQKPELAKVNSHL